MEMALNGTFKEGNRPRRRCSGCTGVFMVCRHRFPLELLETMDMVEAITSSYDALFLQIANLFDGNVVPLTEVRVFVLTFSANIPGFKNTVAPLLAYLLVMGFGPPRRDGLLARDLHICGQRPSRDHGRYFAADLYVPPAIDTVNANVAAFIHKEGNPRQQVRQQLHLAPDALSCVSIAHGEPSHAHRVGKSITTAVASGSSAEGMLAPVAGQDGSKSHPADANLHGQAVQRLLFPAILAFEGDMFAAEGMALAERVKEEGGGGP
ncbi:hypothetical protein B0H11DRAFT_2297208 [Mycena galericulata]|nr:hypothetical protein B0H11DRAFT_2297208 [Mycena galericulata]